MLRQELVLVGAGAAHLVALRRFAMRHLPADTRLVLVVPEAEEPYSGLVPAVMAGRIRRDDAMVDVAALSRSAGARLILAKATALDTGEGLLHLAGGRPPLRYDWLSLCPGAAPALVPGAAEHALPLKPLGRLLDGWEAALRPGLRVVVAGGGAGGVEAALAAATRLGDGRLVTLLGEVLPGLGTAAAARARRALQAVGIRILPGRAARVEHGRLLLEDGGTLAFDLCLWAAGAVPPAWLSRSALERNAQGWFLAEASLRAQGQSRIFLAGDIADVAGAGRAGHGVASVRQGLPLARNLHAVLEGRPLVEFRSQRRHLALLQAGSAAIAAWGRFALAGRWALRWKDRIDRRWIESFRSLPARPMRAMPSPVMRCEGCGGKLAPQVLAAVLARLGGLPGGAPDDAALLPAMRGAVAQSVDLFRAPCDDPWLAGRIAAAHALGDLAAMGAEPRAALALVALPHAAPAVQENDLHALLHGAQGVLRAAGAALLGGHSAEAAEVMIGFSVTGELTHGAALPRGGLRPGDVLVLTRSLGTGAILAGWMHGHGRGAHLAAALDAMQRDPMPAARLLRAHGATAAADVTGFGLLGHLGEMLEASACGAVLDPLAVPALPGALEALARGVRSTLHPGNAEAAAMRVEGAASIAAERLALLLDPQTAGGLLAGLPGDRAAACIAALARLGIAAVRVGRVMPGRVRIHLQPGACKPRCDMDGTCHGNHTSHPGRPIPAVAG